MLNIFHLNVLELDQRIQDELDENPLLEKNDEEDSVNADKIGKEAVQDFQDWEEHGYDDIPDINLLEIFPFVRNPAVVHYLL